jgi:PilZ domain
MSDELKSGRGPTLQRPRSPRVPVDFAVGLEYTSSSGQVSHANGEAIRVSRGGATVITDIPVSTGAVIRLTPPFGRTIDAEVNGVWTDHTDGKQRIGVKLLDANGWFAD